MVQTMGGETVYSDHPTERSASKLEEKHSRINGDKKFTNSN